VIVEGIIVAANSTGKVCFLNFHKNWKRYFTAVIFASDFHKFPEPPKNYYNGKKVRITGLIKKYQGKPEIIIKNPSQIEILEEK
jgi:DNA/RNA endonuclease YhcR with UshA esterase domain